MKVTVYVEGNSDVLSMNELLQPLIEQKQQSGISISFHAIQRGDGKKSVLFEVPERAANMLLAGPPDAFVVALPDLYPRNKGFPHETAQELIAGIIKEFEGQVKRKGHDLDLRTRSRFKAFCFKYELETLILAAQEAFCAALGIPPQRLEGRWKLPVEDQNHDQPPSQIVDALFREFTKASYEKTIDAPLILGSADYKLIADRCPQQFKPFVEFLESL